MHTTTETAFIPVLLLTFLNCPFFAGSEICYRCANEFIVMYWGHFLPIQADDELVADSICIKVDERSEEVQCVGPCLTVNVTIGEGNRTRVIGMMRDCQKKYYSRNSDNDVGNRRCRNQTVKVRQHMLNAEYCFCLGSYCNSDGDRIDRSVSESRKRQKHTKIRNDRRNICLKLRLETVGLFVLVMSDPVAEFLAREQNVLAGIQDDSLGTSPPPYVNSISSNDAVDNGNDTACVNETRLLSGTSDSGLDLPTLANGVRRLSTTPSPSLAAMNNVSKPEPEKIKKWREEQKIMLEKKDKNEERKKEEMRAAGKKELEEWYAQRAERLAKTRAANRKAEEDFISDREALKDGAEWERIAKLCEFSGKNSKTSSDLSRLRTLLLKLKTQKE
uniref:Clathrin light chain n=1 Tax=Wuchereria bancrofti TaxID=6293 RepID=A0A1I8EYE2_WUCBA